MTGAREPTVRDRLFLWYAVAAPPLLWAVHLVAAYAWEEAACSTGEGVSATEEVIAGLNIALGIAIALALAAALLVSRALRRGELFDPRGRVAFMAWVGVLGSLLFLGATVLEGTQIVTFEPCRQS